MTWGSFGTTHLVTLALAFTVNVALLFILKRTTRAKQIITLFGLSLIGVGVVAYGMIANANDILRNLPLDFWALNVLLLPLAVLTRGKKLCNFLLIWSVASIIALVFNASMANVELFSIEFVTYYTMHTFGAGIPVLLFELNLVKRDTKTVKSMFVMTLLAYTSVHIVNLVINSANGWSVCEGVNYMSTLRPDSALLSFLYAIIPSAYWYMVLVLPAILIYVLYWYLPEILDRRRRRHPLREKLKDIDEYYEEYEEEYIDEIIDEKYD